MQTDELSTSYYCCDWEEVIFHSRDAEENKKIMKLIALAIHLNSKPFRLTGLNFSVVNYETVVSVSASKEDNSNLRLLTYTFMILLLSINLITDSERRRLLLYCYLCLQINS